MAKYLSPHYPELRVALGDDKFVQFSNGEAEVEGEDQEGLEAFMANSPEYRIASEEDFEDEPAPDADLGPGYTDAEKLAVMNPPASDSGADEVSEASSADMVEVSDSALVAEEAELGEAEGTQDPDAGEESDLESFNKDELKALAEEKGLSVGGTKEDLIARIQAAE